MAWRTSKQPSVSSLSIVDCGGLRPLLRFPAYTDDDHPVAAISPPLAHARDSIILAGRPAAGAAAPGSTVAELVSRSPVPGRLFVVFST